MKKRNIGLMILFTIITFGIYAIVLLFGFVISPLAFVLWESIVILSLFIAYLVFLVIRTKKGEEEIIEEEAKEEKPRKMWVNIVYIVLGCAAIIFGGDFVVDTASYLAGKLGMSELLISLTIVAVGTSLPELVTSVIASKKGESDIAIGNVVGSNIFNVFFILGITSTISPVSFGFESFIDIIFALAASVLVYLLTLKNYRIGNKKGIILLGSYIAYIAYILIR